MQLFLQLARMRGVYVQYLCTDFFRDIAQWNGHYWQILDEEFAAEVTEINERIKGHEPCYACLGLGTHGVNGLPCPVCDGQGFRVIQTELFPRESKIG